MKGDAGMRLVVHQALKDARLLKWILALWVLLNVALHVLVFFGVRQPPPTGPQAVDIATTAYSVLCAVIVAGFVAIPVVALQHDPGVGTTAFWFTRPISVRLLLAGKFLLVVPAMVLLPVLLDLAALLMAGVPLAAVARPLIEGLTIQIVWLLPVMAIAAFTRDLAQFVLGVILEGLVFITVVLLGPWVFSFESPRHLLSGETIPLFLATLVVASSAVLVFSYRARSVRRSALAAGAAPVIIGALLLTSPGGVLPALGSRTGSSIELRPGALWRTSMRTADCGIWVSFHVVGALRPTETVDVTPYEGSLQYASTRLDMSRVYLAVTSPQPDQARFALLAAAAGDAGGGGERTNASSRDYSFFGSLPPAACRQLAHDRAVVRIGIRLKTIEYRVADTLPLQPGARFRADEVTGEVLDVSTEPTGLSVRTRQAGVMSAGFFLGLVPVLRPASPLRPVLRGPRLGETMLPANTEFEASRFWPLPIPVPQHLEATWRTDHFAGADWLGDARQLVLVESRQLGVTERHLELPNLVLSSLPQVQPPQ